MANSEPNLTKEMLDEYFEKIILKSKLTEETRILSKQIKHEMNKVGRKEFFKYGYKVYIETKEEPNDDFFKLLRKKDLECLITPSISSGDLKKARRRLDLDDTTYYEKYTKEKDIQWLYVREQDNDATYLRGGENKDVSICKGSKPLSKSKTG